MTVNPKILLVDDDEDDSVLIRDLLSEAFPSGSRPGWADGYDSGLSAMASDLHDVYLVDYRLGPRDGLDLVRAAVRQGCKAPIIFLTGQNCRQTDLNAMAAGAVDFLIKGEITPSLLERSIRYAIERKRVEQQLEQLGLEDGLTGISNRTLFENRLEQTIKLARRQNEIFAVVMMDLDGLKAINDTCGHAAGDVVLIEIARRAKAILRESDTIARVGGDEFAAVLPAVGTFEGAVVAAERLVDIANRPIALEQSAVRVGLSVGVAFFPMDGEDPATVLKRADETMYHAKRTGSGFAIAGQGSGVVLHQDG